MHSAYYAVARCLSVHLSVTRRYCIEIAEHVINFFPPPGRPTYSFRCQTFYGNVRTGTPNWVVECRYGVLKIAIFDNYLVLSRK